MALRGEVAHDQRLVVAVGVGLLQGRQDRGGRPHAPQRVAQLRVDRAEHGVGVHEDGVGGEGHEGAARHGVVRHQHRHLALVPLEGVGDLVRGQHQAAGGVQDEVDGHVRRRHADGPQHLLRVLDVDVAAERKAEEPDALLAVDHGDDAGAAALLEGAQHAAPPLVAAAAQPARQEQRQRRRERRSRAGRPRSWTRRARCAPGRHLGPRGGRATGSDETRPAPGRSRPGAGIVR